MTGGSTFNDKRPNRKQNRQIWSIFLTMKLEKQEIQTVPNLVGAKKKKSQQHVKSNTLNTKERSKKRHLTSNTQYIWTGKTQPNRLFRIMILNYMPKRMNSRHLGLDTDNSETLNDITMLSNGISVNNTFVGSFVRVCSLMLFFKKFWIMIVTRLCCSSTLLKNYYFVDLLFLSNKYVLLLFCFFRVFPFTISCAIHFIWT